MRLVVVVSGLIFSAAMLLAAATGQAALAQVAPSAGVEPSASVDPSGSPLPDAVVELFFGPGTETARDWAIKVTGGNPSVDFVTVEEVVGGRFTIAVFGQSATVEMTVTLPSDRVLDHGGCFDPLTGEEHDSLVGPDRVVLQVVQGGFYSCSYGTRQSGPTQPVPNGASVDLTGDSTLRVGRTWDIAVAGGTAQPDVITLDDIGLAGFTAQFFAPSATVEMTVRLPPGWALIHGECFFHQESVRRDVLAGPRRLVIEVVPNGEYSCTYSVGRTGRLTAPPTESVAGTRSGSSSDSWPLVLAVMASVFAASLLIAVRAQLRR